jgi:hypothetical protein
MRRLGLWSRCAGCFTNETAWRRGVGPAGVWFVSDLGPGRRRVSCITIRS